jgi:hypothetical protein
MTMGRFDGQAFRDPSDINRPAYGAPNGGPIGVALASIAYTNTAAKTLFTLPKGAVIIAWLVNVRTAFNSTGTDLLDIGDTTTANRFANDLVLSAAVQLNTGAQVAELFTPLTADTVITAIFVQSVADASAGLADIACLYYLT